MSRPLPLGAWLAVGLALALLLPGLGAAGAWWAVDARQHADRDHRVAQATQLIASASQTKRDGVVSPDLTRALVALGVEANLVGQPTRVLDDEQLAALKTQQLAAAGETVHKPLMTPGLQALLAQPDGKRLLQQHYDQRVTDVAVLFLPKLSASTRLAAAGVTALVLLALVLAGGYVLLRRWVVQPLARLSADVERAAGGDLSVTPVDTRAREVADIGRALGGMADGLRSALAARHAAETQRRFLVTSIAHDLRTPLFTLRGSLEALELGIGAGDHLQRAQDKATLLDGLVDDLFTYSRIEYATPQFDRVPIDAVALAHEAAQTVGGRIVVTAPAGGVTATGDRGALLRVLINLLDNAIRHARFQVELAVTADAVAAVFTVTDDGPGIDPSDLPHLFEPLFRADRTRNSATGGSGLGLAIVERLTAAQDATVRAGSAPGGGAQFSVRCPHTAE